MDGTILIMVRSGHEREKIKYILQNIGSFEIIEAADPGQFFKAIGEPLNPSLIVVDIDMPTSRLEFEILGNIRNKPETANAPVIVTTRSDKIEYREIAHQYAVYDYITKPYQIKRLESSIRSILKVKKHFIYSTENIREITLTFDEYMSRELKLASRQQNQLSIILITPIKEECFEDESGESNLKTNIKELLNLIMENARYVLRSTDNMFANLGRDILLVLPGAGNPEARTVNERIRINAVRALESKSIRFDDYFYSVSVTYPDDGTDFQLLMESAFKRVEDKLMLEKIASIPVNSRKYANRRYNQFRPWF